VRLKLLLAAYGAAGVSFLASLLRDYAVITFTHQDKEFFQLLYVASMAAGFGVNAIALGSGLLGRTALAILSLLGMAVIFVMLPAPGRTPHTVILLGSILLMWIAGAQWSRSLVERGWVFSGRVREAIASAALTILVIAGTGVEPAFLVAVACGTAFSWLMWKTSPGSTESSPSGDTMRDMKKLSRSVILTNIATFSITYWALVQTGRHGEVFGYDNSTAVRFAMYFYQVLTIGSVVLVSLRGNVMFNRRMAWGVAAAGLAFIALFFAPLELALFLIPLAAATVHYGVVLSLQKYS
jgi:hypothetical protein